MTYRLLAGADIDRILLKSAGEWGVPTPERYHLLMLAVFAALGTTPHTSGSRPVARVAGIRVFPLRLGRRLIDPEPRVGNPRQIVVYRAGEDGVVEIVGLAHDRMLLTRAARRVRLEADT